MKLYFFIKVQHTGDTDLGQADVFVKHYAPGDNNLSLKAIFSTKVKVKVTRSLTLASFERAT